MCWESDPEREHLIFRTRFCKFVLNDELRNFTSREEDINHWLRRAVSQFFFILYLYYLPLIYLLLLQEKLLLVGLSAQIHMDFSFRGDRNMSYPQVPGSIPADVYVYMYMFRRSTWWISNDSFVTLPQWTKVRHLTAVWVIRRSLVRFRPLFVVQRYRALIHPAKVTEESRQHREDAQAHTHKFSLRSQTSVAHTQQTHTHTHTRTHTHLAHPRAFSSPVCDSCFIFPFGPLRGD